MLKCKCTKSSRSHLILLILPMLIANNVSALSAESNQSINGTSPFLTFDNGLTKTDSLGYLLSITLPDGKQLTSLDDLSSMSKPIKIIKSDPVKFSEIQTFVPLPSLNNSNYPQESLNNIISNAHYWQDSDGDILDTATGMLSVKWQDSQGNDITDNVKNEENGELKGCDAPYQLTVEAIDGTLTTTYGNPRSSSYIGGKHTYYILPNIPVAKLCYIQPNLSHESEFSSTIDKEQWALGKGFYTNDFSVPSNNFPTTGSNNLFFDLKIVGLAVEDIINVNGNYVNAITGDGVRLSLSDHNGLLRVTLEGPSFASNGGNFSPSTFKLYKDTNKSQLLYSFTIQRWYIARSGAVENYHAGENFCNSLNGNYRVPNVLDFTNSNREAVDWDGGVPGAIYMYQRKISYKNNDGKWMGGLFNEWGAMTQKYYPNSDWEDFKSGESNWIWAAYYWTSNLRTSNSSGDNYVVEANTGIVGDRRPDYDKYRIACVTP